MMNAIVAWWARNPVAGNLLMVTCFIAGLLAYFSMEKEFFPSGGGDAVSVTAAWPGASPSDMESQVTVRLEEATAGIDGINYVRSRAQEGYTWVRLVVDPGADIEFITTEVKARIDAINGLPSGIEPPRVSRETNRALALIVALHGPADEKVLRDTTERLRERIALVDGGANNFIAGSRNPEVSIELSEDALRRYDLTFGDVTQAVRGTSLDASSGRVRTEDGDFQLSVRNEAESAIDFAKVILRETPQGGSITLGDVARIDDSFEDVNLYSKLDGEDSMLIFVEGADKFFIDKTSKAILKTIEEFRPTLPEGVGVRVIMNQSEDFNALTSILMSNAIQGFTLIFLLLLLTLHPKVAFWSTLGVMTAFAGSFIMLPLLDVSLNFMTVFGFLLVLGIMVDDAIIVGESIYERAERGEQGSIDGAILSTQLILKPLIASVFVTMLAFSPWLFISGEVRQFTRALSIVVMSTLVFSLIESLIILPAHLGHVNPPKVSQTFFGRLMGIQQKIAGSVIWVAENIHRPLLTFAIKWRYATFALFFSFFLAAIGLMASNRVKGTFMPEVESDFLFASIELPQSTPFNRLEEVALQMEEARVALAKETQDIAYTDPNTGKLSDGVLRSWSQSVEGNAVRGYISLTPPETREITTKELIERMKILLGPVPDAERISFEFGGNGGGPIIQMALIGDDVDELRAAVEAMKAQLLTYSDITSVRDSEDAANEELQLSLKPGAERLGINLALVTQQVRQAYFGDEAQRQARDGDDVRVYVRYPKEDRRSLESLKDFRIRTPDGREVPLAEVATFKFEPGVTGLDRRNRQRSILIEAEGPRESRAEIMKDLEENYFPQLRRDYPDVSNRNLGEAEAQAEFANEIMKLLMIALLLMYVLLAVVFRAYFRPLMIFTAIPFTIMGAIFAHWLFGTSFGLFSFLGAIAAMGVVVNDNVVLVDKISQEQDAGAGVVPSIIEGTVSRFRQIFLTSVTEFVGLAPMLFEQAVIAQFLKPMALSLAFGVLLCMPVTLILVPCLGAIGHDIANFFRWVWNGRAEKPVPAE